MRCIPQDIRFPTDASILDECRSSAEAIIDTLHKIGMTDGKKPRTYRKKARNAYNSFSKSRKKTRRSIRKAVGQQLRYLRRDLEHITKICARHPEALQFLSKRQYHRLLVIREVYRPVNIPAAGNRHSRKMETAKPEHGNRESGETETGVPVDGNRLRRSRACGA